MKETTLRNLMFAAVFAALVCVATLVIHVPTPLGYVNLGDGVALLAGWLLGPIYGFAAAGIGSALADLFLGYITYVPGTFLIKGLIALIAALLGAGIAKKTRNTLVPSLLSSIVAEAEMVLGYFVYEALPLGYGAGAAVSILTNAVQGVAGVAVFMLLAALLDRTHLREKLS